MKITNSTQYNLPEGAKACIEIGAGDVNYWRCNAIQFSPDGTQLAVASSTWTQTSTNNKIQIYNADSREELEVRIRPMEQQFSIAFSPDGKILASGGDDNEVHLWNVSTGARLSTFKGHTQRVNGVAFSPDGRTLASGSEDHTLRLWDIATGSHKKYKLSGPVTSVAFSIDGKTFAAGAKCLREWVNYYTIYLWESVNHAFLGSRKVHAGGDWISRATFSPDIKTLATQVEGPVVFLWDIDSGGYKGGIEGDRCRYYCEPTCVAFSPDGKTLVSGGGTYPCDQSPPNQSSDNAVYLWDFVKNELKARLIGHTGIVDSIAFSPDGHTLASGSQGQDSTVLLWDVDAILGSVSTVPPVPIPNVITDENKVTVTEKNVELQKRSFQIQKFCKERDITTLVHFTRIENLRSILGEGLRGRSILETRGQVRFNDPQRWDRHKDAICLNISFPNYRLFSKFSRPSVDSPSDYSQWIVLLLKAEVLWELDCAFCQENAASNLVRYVLLEERKKPDALEGLFEEVYCDTNGHVYKRLSQQIPSHYSTHPQAEVLVFDQIRIEYIKEVHFYEESVLEQWHSSNPGNYLPRLSFNQLYFQYPRDRRI